MKKSFLVLVFVLLAGRLSFAFGLDDDTIAAQDRECHKFSTIVSYDGTACKKSNPTQTTCGEYKCKNTNTGKQVGNKRNRLCDAGVCNLGDCGSSNTKYDEVTFNSPQCPKPTVRCPVKDQTKCKRIGKTTPSDCVPTSSDSYCKEASKTCTITSETLDCETGSK